MSKSWYSQPREYEYIDGSKWIEYHLVFETTDESLAKRIEQIFKSIMDEMEVEQCQKS